MSVYWISLCWMFMCKMAVCPMSGAGCPSPVCLLAKNDGMRNVGMPMFMCKISLATIYMRLMCLS